MDAADCNTTSNATQLRNINLAMSITGGIGVLAASMIMVGLLCSRSYKTVLQRIFIYTVLTVIVQDLSHVANLEYLYLFHHNMSLKEKLCGVIGFLSSWSGWCLYIFYVMIILYLLVMVCLQIRSTSSNALQVLKRSPFLRVLLEFVAVMAVILAPVAILWVPYHDKLYGFDGTICFIKQFKANSSEQVGFSYLFVYGFGVYEVIGFITLCIALGMIIIYCTLFTRLQRAKQMVKHLVILISAVVANLLILSMLVAINYLKFGYELNYLRNICHLG